MARATRQESNIAMLQMYVDPVEIVGPERAALAPRFPIGVKHEMGLHVSTLVFAASANALMRSRS